MVEVIFDLAAYKKIKVNSIKEGINSLPKWLKNCMTASQVEVNVELHGFDFKYIKEYLLLILPKEGKVRNKNLVNISFKVANE